MTYATQQDLTDSFGENEIVQLADRDGDGVIDAAIVARALADADELINSYVAKRYDLPLAPVPARLTRLAADIAYFYLFRADPTEGAQGGYDGAVRFLKDLSAGRAELDVAGSPAPPAAARVQSAAPGRVFTDDTLEDY